MIVAFDVLLFAILIVTALLALRVRDLLTAVALLAIYSLFAALLFTGLLALDVALVEAALGAGLTGVLFIAAIMITTRRSTAREMPRHRAMIAGVIAAFLGLMIYASSGLPDRGDPAAPTRTGVAAEYLSRSYEETRTPNVVTAVLADYRSQDTLGETLVIMTAALAAALVLMRRPGDADAAPQDNDTSTVASAGPSPAGQSSDTSAPVSPEAAAGTGDSKEQTR